MTELRLVRNRGTCCLGKFDICGSIEGLTGALKIVMPLWEGASSSKFASLVGSVEFRDYRWVIHGRRREVLIELVGAVGLLHLLCHRASLRTGLGERARVFIQLPDALLHAVRHLPAPAVVTEARVHEHVLAMRSARWPGARRDRGSGARLALCRQLPKGIGARGRLHRRGESASRFADMLVGRVLHELACLDLPFADGDAIALLAHLGQAAVDELFLALL